MFVYSSLTNANRHQASSSKIKNNQNNPTATYPQHSVSDVFFKGNEGSALDGSIIDVNIKLKNILVQTDSPHIELAAVRIGDMIQNVGMQIFSPHIDFSLSKDGSHKNNLTKKDLQPLVYEIQHLKSLLNRQYDAHLQAAEINLQNALDAQESRIHDKNKEVKRYLKQAEQQFLLCKVEPKNFESGITAQLGYSVCRTMLGYEKQGKKEYLEALRTMAESKPLMAKFYDKISTTKKEKDAFLADLIYLQQHGAAIAPGIYRVSCPDKLDSYALGNNFLKAKVDNKSLTNYNFKDSYNFTDFYLKGADFTDSTLKNANFSGMDLKTAKFNNSDLTGANFSNASLDHAAFKGAKLKDTNFTQADIYNAEFGDTPLAYAIFDGVKCYSSLERALSKHKAEKIAQFTEQQNSDGGNIVYTEKYAGIKYNYSNALEGINLNNLELDLSDHKLKNSKLRNLKIKDNKGTDFSGADLTDAAFYASDHSDVNFESANLTNARFLNQPRLVPSWSDKDAKKPANFRYTTLTNTDFSNCKIKYKYLGGILGSEKADFSGAKYYSYPPKLPSDHTPSSLGIRNS